MSMFTKTPNYILAEYDGSYFIKVLAHGVWRDCVGVPELADPALAKMLEEELQREETMEWVTKAGRANPELARSLKLLELKERLDVALGKKDEAKAEALRAEIAELKKAG